MAFFWCGSENDWYTRPAKYSWFHQDVTLLRDTVYNTDIDDEEFITGITAGRGDYFFAYGRLYEFPDDTYGIIHKIGLDGTILWLRKYKDPTYTRGDRSHYCHIPKSHRSLITDIDHRAKPK